MNIKFPGINNISEEAKRIVEAKAGLPNAIEVVNMRATVAKAQYDALTKEGFTTEQAMQILIEHPEWR